MRDRTADLLNANQALSQLSYSPIFSIATGQFTLAKQAKSKKIKAHFGDVYAFIHEPEYNDEIH